VTAVSAGNLANAGDAAEGRNKAETCLGGHAIPNTVNTYPTYKVPKIGGQHAAYIIKALTAYKNKERSHDTMHANAVSLSETDIANIAAYFASIKK